MAREELLARISIDPKVCGGRPCIRGHRIWVSLMIGLLASGMTIKEILQEYPGLTEADVYACIAYGAEKRCVLRTIRKFLAQRMQKG
jgi:uncharacterized protein (DUF433 family)